MVPPFYVTFGQGFRPVRKKINMLNVAPTL